MAWPFGEPECPDLVRTDLGRMDAADFHRRASERLAGEKVKNGGQAGSLTGRTIPEVR